METAVAAMYRQEEAWPGVIEGDEERVEGETEKLLFLIHPNYFYEYEEVIRDLRAARFAFVMVSSRLLLLESSSEGLGEARRGGPHSVARSGSVAGDREASHRGALYDPPPAASKRLRHSAECRGIPQPTFSQAWDKK